MAYRKISGVYCIRNAITGQVYVGSSRNIKCRWSQHRCELRATESTHPRLQASWIEHAESAFTFEIIERVADLSLLIEREQFWISALGSYANGLNSHPNAGSPLGFKSSPETRILMSTQRTGKKQRPRSPEHCLAISVARRKVNRKGVKRAPFTAEHKAAIRAARLVREPLSLEGRKRMSDSHKGKKLPPFTEKHRLALSEAAKQYHASKSNPAHEEKDNHN